MGQILLKSQNIGTTLVSNSFIDNYIPQMNEAQIKVYLYLLRCIGANMPVSVPSIADNFNYIENDVLRSLRSLDAMGLISVELDPQKGGEEAIRSIFVNDCVEWGPRRTQNLQSGMGSSSVKASEPVTDHGLVIPPMVSATSHFFTAEQLTQFKERSDVQRLIYVAEQLLGKTLSADEMNTLLYIFENLGFPVELIEFLVEHCVSCGGKNIKYIETVALEWHKKGITDLQSARLCVGAGRHYKDGYKVLKALGITNRSLISDDMAYVNKWLDDYGMQLEVVLEACSRTIKTINKPSLAYTDGILSKWNKNGVKRMEEIKAADEAFAASRKSAEETKKALQPQGSRNRFKNFDERDDDMDALTREILEKQKPI